MKLTKIKRIISSVLVAAMFVPNAAYAESVIDTGAVAEGIGTAISYGVDKIKNTVEESFSFQDNNSIEDDETEEEFHDPGMTLSKRDINRLYHMGYSMVDISNAIKLSKQCEETPYAILQRKGLTTPGIQVVALNDTSAETELADKTWQEVKQELGAPEETEVQENSKIIYEGEPDDVGVLFEQLGLSDMLRENDFQESEIQEAIESGIIEKESTNDVDSEDDEETESDVDEDTDEAVILTKDFSSLETVELMSNENQGDETTSYYNGYIYPMTKYNNEKTSGYTVTSGYDINPVSGNLTVVENDLSLKGINGLDLNLNRVYSSERANMLDAQTWLYDPEVTMQHMYYRVRSTADVTVTYREATTNGGTPRTITKQHNVTLAPSWKDDSSSGFPIYTAVDDDFVDQQIEKGIVSSLFKTSAEAEQARVKGYDGYYDKTITFPNGKIAKITISIINDMDCIFKEVCNVPIPAIPYYTTTETTKKAKSFSDLGAGWEFDFPYIEIRKEPVYDGTTYDEYEYEYLHYGTKGTWYFDEYENESNLAGYLLKDMKLTRYYNKFDNRSTAYLLTESDGKKHYFGTRGELLGIEDRFGNKIKFYYSNNEQNNYVLTKIIDTVGRNIIFDYSRSEDITAWDPLQSKEVNSKRCYIDIKIDDPNTSETRTISYVKDKILGVGLTRYDIDNEEYIEDITERVNMYKLAKVYDAERLETTYSYNISYAQVSMTDKNMRTYGSEIPYSSLEIKTYPTGANTRFIKTTEKDNFGTDGAQIHDVYNRAVTSNRYYKSNGNLSSMQISDEYITHSTRVKDDSSTAIGITTASGYPHYRNIQEMPSQMRYVVNIQNTDVGRNNGNVYLSNAYKYDNDEILLDYSTAEAVDANDTVYRKETTEYTYNNRNLCTNRRIKHFESGTDNQNYIEETVSMTYDDYGNMLTQRLNNDKDRETTYEYNTEYHYPIKKTYKSNSGTTIVEKYTPSSDNKTIKESTVLENNSTKKKTAYEYDSYGNVVKEKQYGVNGDMNKYSVIEYSYSGNGNVISNAYVTSVKASDLKDADNAAIQAIEQKYVYDYFGNVTSESDGNGNTYRYEYDKNNRLKKMINPDGSTKTYSYDVQCDVKQKILKNQVTVTNENGIVIRNDYNSIGDLTSKYNVTDDKQITAYESSYIEGKDIVQTCSDVNNSSKSVISYDSSGRKISTEVFDNNENSVSKESYSYEVLPSVKQFKTTTTVYGDTEAENVRKVQYTDVYGNVLKEEVIYKENGTDKTAVTEYTYDYLGNVRTVREPRANEENWSPNEYTAQYEYDIAGNVTKETDINGKSIVNTYDGLGNLISVKDKNGNTSTTTYDALGRILKEQIPFQKNGISTVYAENKYYYDANGNTIKSQTANNAAGSATSYTTTEYVYNWQNQPTKVKGFNGNKVESSVQYYYDSVGNVLRMYTGDVDSLVINGLDSVSGANNYAVTKYVYDSMNRCISQTDALGQTVSNTYDINGNLIKTTDRNGNVLSYSYDGLNQLLQKSSSKTDADTYAYSYNKKGNRTSMTGGGVDTTSIYDNLGRLTKENLTDGTVKEYTYDINGNRKSFKLIKDNAVQYTLTYDYDKQNQLTKVYEDGTVKAEYTYNPDGTLKKSSYGSRTTDYSYNLAQLLTEVNNANGSTQISKYSYTYYVDGNQKSKTESAAGTNKGTTNYTYDGLNRLIKEQAPDKTYSYQYDSYGNRSQLSVTGDETYTTSYTYDKNNRMRNQTKTAGSAKEITDYWYDPNGNQISSMTVSTGGTGTPGVGIEPAGNSGNSVNEYNSWNQLTKTMQNGKIASYTYNGDGLRMSKTVDGTTTSHIWDGTNIAGDVTNGTVTKYIRGLQLISSKKGSSESFYNFNGHGDVVQITNSSGSVIKQYSYDAFGVEQNKADNDVNPFRYCGEYFDSEADSVYLRARYYVPVSGRFITEDPIRDGLNWYTYCGANPVNMVDPWGLEYGALRDFVEDYYEAFGGNTKIEQGEFAGKKCAIVTLGSYQQRFFYDGTVLVENRNEDGSLSGLEFVSIANNIDGSLYLQRSAFVIAMGMTEDGTAKVTVSDEFYVGDMLSMLDFATNISDSVNSGGDVKDFVDFFAKAPVLGQYIQIGVTLNDLYKKLRDGEIMSTGYYRAESVVVQSPEFSWYSYKVDTLYGTQPETSYYQWYIKSAYAWGWFPGGE